MPEIKTRPATRPEFLTVVGQALYSRDFHRSLAYSAEAIIAESLRHQGDA